jgi:hypothetical protein
MKRVGEVTRWLSSATEVTKTIGLFEGLYSDQQPVFQIMDLRAARASYVAFFERDVWRLTMPPLTARGLISFSVEPASGTGVSRSFEIGSLSEVCSSAKRLGNACNSGVSLV